MSGRELFLLLLHLFLAGHAAAVSASPVSWEAYDAAVSASEAVLETADTSAAMEELFRRYVAFETISKFSSDAYVSELEGCASWLASLLTEQLGMENAKTYKSGWRFPVVVGSSAPFDSDKPGVLVYGHYDVQPVDGEWKLSAPFEMKRVTLGDGFGEVYTGRGSQDDKGNSTYKHI